MHINLIGFQTAILLLSGIFHVKALLSFVNFLCKIYENSQWKTSNTDQPTTSVYINKSPQIGFPKKKKEIAESL